MAFYNQGDQAGIAAYFRDVRKTCPLSREDEKALGQRIQEGDLQARNELVTANLRFGVAMAKSYQGRGLSLDELISAANQGLIEAADRFDSRNGARFITYASWWIRRYVGRALDEGSRPRPPACTRSGADPQGSAGFSRSSSITGISSRPGGRGCENRRARGECSDGSEERPGRILPRPRVLIRCPTGNDDWSRPRSTMFTRRPISSSTSPKTRRSISC